jgi:hypothetical protein
MLFFSDFNNFVFFWTDFRKTNIFRKNPSSKRWVVWCGQPNRLEEANCRFRDFTDAYKKDSENKRRDRQTDRQMGKLSVISSIENKTDCHKALVVLLNWNGNQYVKRGDENWVKRKKSEGAWRKSAPRTFWRSTHGVRVDFGITRLLQWDTLGTEKIGRRPLVQWLPFDIQAHLIGRLAKWQSGLPTDEFHSADLL